MIPNYFCDINLTRNIMNKNSNTKHIDALHFEHQLWLSRAKFYTDELVIYQKRLEYIAGKNNKEEVRKQVEHFQNQFIIQETHLSKLNHEVKAHEKFLATFAENHPVAIDHRLFEDHKLMHERMDIFKKLYDDLKNEFNAFLSTWM